MSVIETMTANLAGKVRIENLDGKRYLVAPLTLIVPGVLNGSQGPLFYPKDEIEKSFDAWNGVPIVVNHPKDGGKSISARNPRVLAQSGIGRVYNTKVKNKLIAEGWFDVEKTTKVDERILQNLEDGIPMELSTGLGVTNHPAEPNSSFNGVAYNYIARNYKPDHLAVLPDDVGACSLDDGCGVLVNKETLSNKGKSMAKLSAKKRGELVEAIIENCDCPDTDKEIFENLSDVALKAMHKSYTDNAELTTTNEQLELVANAAKKGFEDPGGNTHIWNSETNTWESKIAEPKKEEKKETEVTENAETKPQTFEEWMEAAPDEVRSAVENSRKIEAREKRSIVDKLLLDLDEGEGRNKLSKRLMSKSLVELEELSLLAPKVEEAPPVTANYLGAAVPATNQSKFDKTDTLGLPTMDFSTSD